MSETSGSKTTKFDNMRIIAITALTAAIPATALSFSEFLTTGVRLTGQLNYSCVGHF
jgi:hypothetical protein